MHDSRLELPSNKKFGIFFTIVFLCLSIYFFPSDLSIYLFFISGILLIVSILKAEMLIPFNKVWMYIGFSLGRIISPIVLGLIFFGLFTPISLITRLFGRDELSIQMKKKNSYWKKRDSDFAESNSFKFQF